MGDKSNTKPSTASPAPGTSSLPSVSSPSPVRGVLERQSSSTGSASPGLTTSSLENEDDLLDFDESKPTEVDKAFIVIDAHEDKWMEYFRRPHTVTVLLLGLAVLVHLAFNDADADPQRNLKRGMLGSCLIFLVFCSLQLRETIFTRPHPVVWRIVTGIGVLYLMALAFMLFQTVHDGRQLLRFFYPELGVPLPERSYAEDCRVYTPENPDSSFYNIKATLLDEFVLAHLLGWWGKAVIVRDWRICWALSIIFELMEMSLEHMLPNFKECWWDHLVFDILVCNALGIYLGILTCRYFDMRGYNWVGLSQQRGAGNKLKRLAMQFTPMQVDRYSWDAFSSPKRFLQVCILFIVFNMVELSAFFLKFVLWVPPRNPLNVYRLCIWASLAAASCREYYQFITDKNCNRFGTMSWLVLALAMLEVLVCFKYGRNMFPNPAPPTVVYAWTVGLSFISLLLFLNFYFRRRNAQKKEE